MNWYPKLTRFVRCMQGIERYLLITRQSQSQAPANSTRTLIPEFNVKIRRQVGRNYNRQLLFMSPETRKLW